MTARTCTNHNATIHFFGVLSCIAKIKNKFNLNYFKLIKKCSLFKKYISAFEGYHHSVSCEAVVS